jgi:hypothetical protein
LEVTLIPWGLRWRAWVAGQTWIYGKLWNNHPLVVLLAGAGALLLLRLVMGF